MSHSVLIHRTLFSYILLYSHISYLLSQGLPDELIADKGRVKRFILAIRESMYDNAYHNFYHVFDVTQTV